MDKSKDYLPGIDCTVTSCVYNMSKKCSADGILVSPKSDENDEHADCVTFEEKY